MQSNEPDIASIWDMVQAIQYIQAFTEDINFESYLDDMRTSVP